MRKTKFPSLQPRMRDFHYAPAGSGEFKLKNNTLFLLQHLERYLAKGVVHDSLALSAMVGKTGFQEVRSRE